MSDEAWRDNRQVTRVRIIYRTVETQSFYMPGRIIYVELHAFGACAGGILDPYRGDSGTIVDARQLKILVFVIVQRQRDPQAAIQELIGREPCRERVCQYG